MKPIKRVAMILLYVFFSLNVSGQFAWINELHYDNEWKNVNDMVEVVVRNTGEYELENFRVELIDGATGRVYKSIPLDMFTPGDTVADCLIYYYNFMGDSLVNGIGGIALSYDSTVIDGYSVYSQFISYGGIIMPVDGTAKGKISHNIGLIENTTTPHSTSIQLSGEHWIWWGFTWEHGVVSMGSENINQTINQAPMVLIWEDE